MTGRPLDVRLTEYRDSLRSQADQLDAIGASLGTGELAEASRFMRVVADDLTTMLDGGELRAFVITGVMPWQT